MTDCNHNYLIVDGFHTCILCGVVDMDRIVFYESTQKIYKPYFIYYRKSYFREKLRLLAGIKQSLSDEYPSVITFLKTLKFNTIQELRKLMHKHGYHRYYKYIYSIFYEIKGHKLVNLNLTQIEFLTNKFIKIEHAFKSVYPTKNNLLSYNIVIYLLLQKYHPNLYKQILLPKNFRKLVKSISHLLNIIEK